MTRSLDQRLADYLVEGDEDYIGLWQIVGDVASSLKIDEKKMTIAETEKFWSTLSDFITHMLNSGFIAVDLTRDGGYTAWSEQEPEQVMAKIRDLVLAAQGKLDDMMYGVWFYKIPKQSRPNR